MRAKIQSVRRVIREEISRLSELQLGHGTGNVAAYDDFSSEETPGFSQDRRRGASALDARRASRGKMFHNTDFQGDMMHTIAKFVEGPDAISHVNDEGVFIDEREAGSHHAVLQSGSTSTKLIYKLNTPGDAKFLSWKIDNNFKHDMEELNIKITQQGNILTITAI